MATVMQPMHDGAISTSLLRCHLLIGAPGSGKTTLAHALAPLLSGAGGEPGLVLSTDAIRAELFGDAAVQGPWDEIRALLLQRLHGAVEAGTPVIIDATHARRPWRPLYTQGLQLPRPVEWIGWWLTTPLEQCKAWALRRDRPVPEAVIEEFHASLNHKTFKPDRSEGFAVIVALNPAAGEGDTADLSRPLAALDGRIRNSLNRQRSKDSQCHRYSRLLDLERLLFLIRLLTSFNGLDEADPGTASALLQICNPPPQGIWPNGPPPTWPAGRRSMAATATAMAMRPPSAATWPGWRPTAFSALTGRVIHRFSWRPLQASPAAACMAAAQPWPILPPSGGSSPSCATSSRNRSMRPIPASPLQPGMPLTPARRKRSKRSSNEFGPLYRHLLERLGDIEGAYAPDQEAVLRYDLEHALRPYGFLPQVKGRPHSLRQGYAIGTALLSADQLLEVHALLKASLDRLSDQSQLLLLTLEDRLRRRLLDAAGVAPRLRHAKRALAHRSFTEEKPGTLADPQLTPRLERTVRDRRRVWLRHLPDPIDQARRNRGDDGRFRPGPCSRSSTTSAGTWPSRPSISAAVRASWADPHPAA